MSPSPDAAVAEIRRWFAGLPPQDHRRSVTFELPEGRGAPSADTLVAPTRIEADDSVVVIVLDDWIELRFRDLGRVDRISEDQVELSGFEELLVFWHGPGGPPARRYREGRVRFASGHRVGRSVPEPFEGVRWENPL